MITRLLREQGLAFDPEDVAQLDAAYHDALDQLGLADTGDAATLAVARHILDFAAMGERDPRRLTAATVRALSK